MKVTGKLTKVDLGAGSWVVVGDDGRRFELRPPPTGHADGDRVEIDGDVDGNAVSFAMTAPTLKIRSIRKV